MIIKKAAGGSPKRPFEASIDRKWWRMTPSLEWNALVAVIRMLFRGSRAFANGRERTRDPKKRDHGYQTLCNSTWMGRKAKAGEIRA
ncbi:MAG: hypothetical protein LAO21_11740 [Acidobacteriia bacterium]|nr:hypothetical protein [Terriglobia bacterium]